MIALYNILLFFLVLIGFPIVLPLLVFSEKRRKTFPPRIGLSRCPSPVGPASKDFLAKGPIWVHALSVGEVLSAEPLLSAFNRKHPDHPLYLSVSTLTGYELARRRFQGRVTAIGFFPYDIPFSVRQSLSRIRPEMIFFVETDIWPNFMSAVQKRGIPAFWVNARLSERSYRWCKRFAGFFRPVFSVFTYICVQTDIDAERFRGLGVLASRIRPVGNLKYDQARVILSPAEIRGRRRSFGIDPTQPVILAGSTHPGEETILLDAFSRLKQRHPGLLLIVAPRDPKRADAVAQLAKSVGLTALCMAALSESPEKSPDAIIIDRIGLLRELYALADIAFVGGSLVPQRGHNPLEPAAWAKPILFGPDMSDFIRISEALASAGGAVAVHDAASFYHETAALLADPQKADTMGKNALSIFQANIGAVENILSLAQPFLAPNDIQEQAGVSSLSQN